jgi:hypothetical protein
MVRKTTLVTGLVWLVAACGQMPTAPDLRVGATLADEAGSGGSATTRGGKPTSPSTFTFQFISGLNSLHPNDISGEPVVSEVSGGPMQLTGTVSGAPGSRVFTLAGGPLTLTIQNVRRDHAGDGCGTAVEDLLRNTKHLVGYPLNGAATKLQVDEANDTVNLEVDGIAGADGQTWNVFLFSTSGSHAQITDVGGVIRVIQNYGEVSFRVPAPRGNKNLEAYGACKLYFGLDLTPAP